MTRQSAPITTCFSHDLGINVGVSDINQNSSASDEPLRVGGLNTPGTIEPAPTTGNETKVQAQNHWHSRRAARASHTAQHTNGCSNQRPCHSFLQQHG